MMVGIMPRQSTRSSVPTPALVIDLTALERNVAAMSALAAQWGVHLRPHAKSHKCVAIARRQIAAGAVGVSCATLDEVAAMVAGGVCGALADLAARRRAEIRPVGKDCCGGIRASWWSSMIPAAIVTLDALSNRLGTRLRVLVDFDVGQRRTGVSDGR